jgi:hypothetical protein
MKNRFNKKTRMVGRPTGLTRYHQKAGENLLKESQLIYSNIYFMSTII